MRVGRRVQRGVAIWAVWIIAVSIQLAVGPAATEPAHAEGRAPKAVFIVGPTNGLTDSNLADAARMADQAAAEGMNVRRVFFPNATWDNVIANIQGASLVVYMGHGYGWPSPYTSRITESRQNGFGLNSFAGSGRAQYTYYGATPIRANVVLAPNAVVILVHGCYTAGNGEPGMAIPRLDLARARVDNYASGFLAAGAGAVFAFGWNQKVNFPHALATSDSTMDELFMTPGGGSPAGFVGWRDRYLESVRTPGTTIHLDPHPTHGYYRSVAGDLDATAANWRAGAGLAPRPPSDDSDPPQVTELTADSGSSSMVVTGERLASAFHPNGDGLYDQLQLTHVVTRASYLDVSIVNGARDEVRAFSTSSGTGYGTSRWDGRDDGGAIVPDGEYTLTYVPRDALGLTGTPVSTTAIVLTAIAVAPPTRAAIHVSDADALSRSAVLKIYLNQPARLTWKIVDAAGATVRVVRDNVLSETGTQAFAWDGRADSGAWVGDGLYRSIVSAQTGLGSYSHERSVYVGAFRVTPSSPSPARGERVLLNIVSSEPLQRSPTVRVTQPGLEPWTVSASHVGGRRYKVSITLKMGGSAGLLELVVSGIDTDGGKQSSVLNLTLR